jgi:ketosteroid isomerase-like protein
MSDDERAISGYTLSILRKQADGKWLLWRDANMAA